jgi:hypothetical protein
VLKKSASRKGFLSVQLCASGFERFVAEGRRV